MYDQKLILLRIKILEAAYLCCSGEKKENVSRGPKRPLMACVFYFVLIHTCFWLHVNRYVPVVGTCPH